MKEGYSSGGFSTLWAAPSWQSNATRGYLDSGAGMPSSGFNRQGRGVPDIAALSGTDAEGWQIRFDARWSDMEGTSTSAPLIASLVAKLNAKRLANGQGTMGFMNPWLYSTVAAIAGALYDVTEGHNTASGGASTSKGVFYCAKGWDPVTGLGTPRYEILEQLALQAGVQVLV